LIDVLAVERAYVAAATGGIVPAGGDPARLPEALAALGAVASRYLAVGTPRTFGIVAVGGDGELSLEAHRTWFAPREVRRATPDAPAAALACDIVCIHEPIAIASAQLRRGTHVNVLAPCTFDPELVALVADETVLGAMAAGLRDGRQLDELTLFVAGDAALALAALTCTSSSDRP
jgi:hypothetical protein